VLFDPLVFMIFFWFGSCLTFAIYIYSKYVCKFWSFLIFERYRGYISIVSLTGLCYEITSWFSRRRDRRAMSCGYAVSMLALRQLCIKIGATRQI